LASVRDSSARLGLRSGWPKGPLLLAGAVLIAGVLLRVPVFTYDGAATQRAFNHYIFNHPGSYSDIASLYFRDRLWLHPAPYFDYKFEYPVITGGFVWVVSFIHSSVATYTLASAALLVALGLAAVVLVNEYEGSKVWLLAAAPVLGLDAVLNWDLLAIALTAAALLLYQRDRDGWAGGLLSLAVWAKLFPLLLLPLIVVARVRERRWRSLRNGLLSFGLVSAAVNLPVAIQHAARGGGLVARAGWAYFYTFNERRRDMGGLWWFFGWLHPHAPEVNRLSGVLLALALLAVLAAMLLGARRVPPGRLPRAARVVCVHQQNLQSPVRPLGGPSARDRGRAAVAGDHVHRGGHGLLLGEFFGLLLRRPLVLPRRHPASDGSARARAVRVGRVGHPAPRSRRATAQADSARRLGPAGALARPRAQRPLS
jgi:hypothetical protein